MRWRNARQRYGARGLEVCFSPGRPPRLDRKQQKRLLRMLLKGPLSQGYRTNLWTTARIAEVIHRKFDVEYHRDHVGRMMHQLGWSPQKPERRAIERDEDAVRRWKKKAWPRVKKRRAAGRPHSVHG